LGVEINDDRMTLLQDSGINIIRRMDFEKTMLKSSQSYYINYLKYKINKYPFNELKISLKNILFDDKF